MTNYQYFIAHFWQIKKNSDESIIGYETPYSRDGLFIDLLSFQSVGMGNLELFCSMTEGRGIFLRYRIPDSQTDPKARENFSVVMMPEKLEVDMIELDNNIEAIPRSEIANFHNI